MNTRALGILASIAVALGLCAWLAISWPRPTGEEAGHPEGVVHTPVRNESGELAAPAPELPPETFESPDPALSARSVAVEASVPSSRLRGRLVDRRTGDGLDNVFVRIRSMDSQLGSSDTTDSAGRFVSRHPYEPTRLMLIARCKFTGKTLGKRSLNHSPQPSGARTDEVLWAVESGPTLRLVIDGGPAAVKWRARIVETKSTGERREWSWIKSWSRGGRRLARYKRVQHEPDPDWFPRVEVGHELGVWLGQAPLSASVGVLDATVTLSAALASVTGRVVDSSGSAVQANLVLLRSSSTQDLQRSEERTSTDEDGNYELHGLAPGPASLFVTTDHHGGRRVDLNLLAGLAHEQDIVLSTRPIVGDVSGVLLGPTEGEGPFAMVRLRSLDHEGTDLFTWAGLRIFGPAEEPGRSPFAFEGLPAGAYELNVLAFDGREYEPATQVVKPPSQGAVFRTETISDPLEELGLSLAASDASTGERLPSARVLMRFFEFWGSKVEDDLPNDSVFGINGTIPFSLIVGAPGHRPAFFELSSAQRSNDQLVLRAPLQPGHGAALVVLDAEHWMGGAEAGLGEFFPLSPLPGARILVDGLEVGRSDEKGLALVTTSAPIASFEAELPGWRTLSNVRFQNHQDTPDGIGFVLMVRQ